MAWRYIRNGREHGPIELERLKELARAGELDAADLVWTEGWAQWIPAESAAELADLFTGQERETADARGAAAHDRSNMIAPPPGLTRTLHIRPVSYPCFVCMFVGGLVVFAVANAFRLAAWPRPSVAFSLLMVPAALLLLSGSIYGLIILHRAWKLVPPDRACTTPSRAVGLLLIPIVNIFWAFQAYAGFASDYQEHVQQQDPDSPDVSHSVALVMCVSAMTAWIPVIEIVLFSSMLTCGLHLVYIGQLAAAVNYAAGKGGQTMDLP